jgi:hypothetical protein
VVGGEPAAHHVDPGFIPGSGVVFCDLVDAFCIALPMRVCAFSLQYMITKWGKVNKRSPSAPGHITSHNRVTEILELVRKMHLIDTKKVLVSSQKMARE